MKSFDILKHLVAFPTMSEKSNLDLIDYVAGLFGEHEIQFELDHDETGRKANLHATVGPRDRSGVLLSGHTDVVPVEGQHWSLDPFSLTERDGKLYGRGTADMKGFVACAIRAIVLASKRDLKIPLHLALSYDEEIGCVGVRHLIEVIQSAPICPAACIVGEPTSMAVATGHKGKTALRAKCIGREAHSALAPTALNAVHLSCDFINTLREKQSELVASGHRDDDYDVPYSTLHVGKVMGGVALNIVPNLCTVDFEIRNIVGDDPECILADLRSAAVSIVEPMRGRFPEADISIEVVNAYPGLDTSPDADIVGFVKSLIGANSTTKVAFGTEGGLFSERLGVPTVVCGPGSMDQGHKPDEFVARAQIEKCDAMLGTLIEKLCE